MIEATGISHRYDRDRWIFQDVSLKLDAGQVLAVLGPNARGKTTMIKCLAGVIAPTRGTVSHRVATGYVPQSHSAAAAYPVREMVLMGRARFVKAWSSPSKEDAAIADAAIERVGLGHLADRDYRALSGGERQMVLIARALASGCGTMILDEPASALDLKNQARVLGVLNSLAQEGMTIVMTTHHPDHALRIADRTMLIVDSDDIRIGDTGHLLTDETLSALYGLPIGTQKVCVRDREQHVIVPDFGVQRPMPACSDSGCAGCFRLRSEDLRPADLSTTKFNTTKPSTTKLSTTKPSTTDLGGEAVARPGRTPERTTPERTLS